VDSVEETVDGAPIDGGSIASAIKESLGELLREARAGRFTIEELSQRASVSAGRISQIERGIANPSFETLWRLATALEVPIGSLFPADGGDQDSVVRKDERRRLEIPHDGLVYEMLTPSGQDVLEILLLGIPPGYDGGAKKPLSHRGHKFFHVFEGQLMVSAGGRVSWLDAGDSITFDATEPHFVANRGRTTAHIQIVVTPPSF
jgi:transcriptional regulator with XRE-family HTH domain